MNEEIVLGKGNLLDLIQEYNPKLAGNYKRLSGNDPECIKQANSFLKKYQSSLLRSDATCEDKFGTTFAGLFKSKEVTTNNLNQIFQEISMPHDFATLNTLKFNEIIDRKRKELEEEIKKTKKIVLEIGESDFDRIEGFEYLLRNLSGELDDLKTQEDTFSRIRQKLNNFESLEKVLNHRWRGNSDVKDITTYSNFRGANMFKSRMDFILHEKYPITAVLIMEHPNHEGLIHIEFQKDNSMFGIKSKRIVSEDLHYDQIPNSEFIPKGIKNLVEHYKELMTDSRIDKCWTYVIEAGFDPNGDVNANKIVQIRPTFRKYRENIKNKSPLIFGTPIPNEGLIFEYNSKLNRYPGLAYTQHRMSRLLTLPLDIILGEKIKLVVVNDGSGNQYIDHAGLLNLERVDIYDSSRVHNDELDELWGEPKIRYVENSQAFRKFEKA